MSHVSSKRVNELVLKKIYKLIFSAIANRDISKKQQQDAFGELLTHTEKIMLGKRLAAISMLSQGVSAYETGKILELHTTTVSKLRVKMDNGKFKNSEKMCATLRKGPLKSYIENLLKPLPKYGTSLSSVVRENLN